MGFTVVDVNMRGTGCSGGAFDFFEPLQGLDGYDVIETIARQPWVKGGKVGMMGISYGGISQLFTGQYNPPSLAALTPISVIDNVQTTLYPGGILNTGFALEWAKDRIHDALPSGPDTGQPWAWEQIQAGDTVCAENQAMHGEARNLLKKIHANRTYRPRVADPLSPITFADKIEAPTFLACQWEDEQTGGHCPTLAAELAGNDRAWSTFTNGTHVDSLSPEVFNRWFDFLKLYVAEEPPLLWSPVVQAGAPIVYQVAFGIDGRDHAAGSDSAGAHVRGRARGLRSADPGPHPLRQRRGRRSRQAIPRLRAVVRRVPAGGTEGQSWYLAEDGKLADKAPKAASSDSFVWDDDVAPADQLHRRHRRRRQRPLDRHSRVRVVAARRRPRALLRLGAARRGHDRPRVGIRQGLDPLRGKRNVDLQATVSEVRPDDKEVVRPGRLAQRRACESSTRRSRRRSRPSSASASRT